MKTRKILPVLTFLAGIVAGGMLIGLMSFSGPNPPDDPVLIDANAANVLYRAYGSSNPAKYSNTIRGLFIDKAQYNAMASIFSADTSINGFRIYYGRDVSSTKVAIVVGTKWNDTAKAYKDVTTDPGKIYQTVIKGVGPCPDICDATSPIVK